MKQRIPAVILTVIMLFVLSPCALSAQEHIYDPCIMLSEIGEARFEKFAEEIETEYGVRVFISIIGDNKLSTDEQNAAITTAYGSDEDIIAFAYSFEASEHSIYMSGRVQTLFNGESGENLLWSVFRGCENYDSGVLSLLVTIENVLKSSSASYASATDGAVTDRGATDKNGTLLIICGIIIFACLISSIYFIIKKRKSSD